MRTHDQTAQSGIGGPGRKQSVVKPVKAGHRFVIAENLDKIV
jgi:hypothetical protein